MDLDWIRAVNRFNDLGSGSALSPWGGFGGLALSSKLPKLKYETLQMHRV